ncbi:18185_t:CDS:2 [Funneliformis geosporum]|uniref:18185_t:CDS:1 n=1 Tax=Funneliformis geosporum TaxID=1117311 RepID=A0A9W4WRU2_9GLOM|nr:18185_t:CDS:2 [Funneliformis geosporum]
MTVPSDIQIKFALRPHSEFDNCCYPNNRCYKFFRNTDQEHDQQFTEFYTRLYKMPFDSHVQGCTKEHTLPDKDKLDEIIDSVILSEFRKEIEEKVLLHSSLYELILPEFKCHGLGFYYKPESDYEMFNKNLEACYYEACPMYVENVDSTIEVNYLERWNKASEQEKEIFACIAMCAKKVFEFMYPNYKEIEENMKQNNSEFSISIEFNPRRSKLFKDDEKDKSLFDDRREMNLRSIERCSKLLDNLTDESSKGKKEFQDRNLVTSEQPPQPPYPQLSLHGSWEQIGKRIDKSHTTFYLL